MPPAALPRSPIAGLRTVELGPNDAPMLQRFFEANPAYLLAVHGEPTGPHEAFEEIHGELPSGWGFTKKWLVGYVDDTAALVAMANVVTDLLAPRIWHIGLFVVASTRHDSGEAKPGTAGLKPGPWPTARSGYGSAWCKAIPAPSASGKARAAFRPAPAAASRWVGSLTPCG